MTLQNNKQINTMKTLNPFKNANVAVSIDWDYALQRSKDVGLIGGEVAINILAEYGVIAYKCASPPLTTPKLAVVISPPFVRFCPSIAGLNGVFIEDYQEEKHGKCFIKVFKKDIFSYGNIYSRIDGWKFSAEFHLSFIED